MGYYKPIVYVVPPAEDGWVLKTILQHRLHISRKLLSRLKLTERGITVNGDRVYISVRVCAGDRVEVRMEEEESDDILPQELPLSILYEDDCLLIVDKPAGMIVHPTHGHYTGTLANAVVYHWRKTGESYRFRPIHRLDRETSGVLAIAKNPYAHQNIAEQMKENAVDKEYAALVYGVMAEDAGTIDAPIDRNPDSPHVRIVTSSGYRAVTHYRVERRFATATLVRLRLETGRTHQIRVHLQHLGHPIIGDGMYLPASAGEPEDAAHGMPLDPLCTGMRRQALHAAELGFRHPASGETVRFAAPLPDDFQAAVAVLEESRRRV